MPIDLWVAVSERMDIAHRNAALQQEVGDWQRRLVAVCSTIAERMKASYLSDHDPAGSQARLTYFEVINLCDCGNSFNPGAERRQWQVERLFWS